MATIKACSREIGKGFASDFGSGQLFLECCGLPQLSRHLEDACKEQGKLPHAKESILKNESWRH
jgi:hypothetical protein